MFTNEQIEEQIKRIDVCLSCEELDGCYLCRKATADMDLVIEMLKELLK